MWLNVKLGCGMCELVEVRLLVNFGIELGIRYVNSVFDWCSSSMLGEFYLVGGLVLGNGMIVF